jgi:predicted  nucleic acid-binding Zn-ribbon protein
LKNIHAKETIRDFENAIVDVNNEISGFNNNITSVSEILSGLENTHVKDIIREIEFQIYDLRDEIIQRMTACERKIEDYDNILADFYLACQHQYSLS